MRPPSPRLAALAMGQNSRPGYGEVPGWLARWLK